MNWRRQSTLPQDLERQFESTVLSSTYRPSIYLHPFAAYVRNSVNGQPRAAQPRSGLPLEQNKYLMSCTGGCGLGGRDDPSLNAHPDVDIGEQYDVYDPRYSPHVSALLHPSTLDRNVTEVQSLEHRFGEVKLKHPDPLLFVECVYNFRFFGEDADLAYRIYVLFSLIKTSTQPASRVCVSRTTLVGWSMLATRSALFVRLRRQRSNMPVTKHRVLLLPKSVRSAPEV